ncbi:unnamed protein product [Cuscuta campestris]|uniref:Uncharacterized protein n=1 Tax=Cuscuta campestris TaxID=132261 RepID=A0A484K5S9_9ASTE|nr:unnamed protein product [Cuscuta campestris]
MAQESTKLSKHGGLVEGVDNTDKTVDCIKALKCTQSLDGITVHPMDHESSTMEGLLGAQILSDRFMVQPLDRGMGVVVGSPMKGKPRGMDIILLG